MLDRDKPLLKRFYTIPFLQLNFASLLSRYCLIERKQKQFLLSRYFYIRIIACEEIWFTEILPLPHLSYWYYYAIIFCRNNILDFSWILFEVLATKNNLIYPWPCSIKIKTWKCLFFHAAKFQLSKGKKKKANWTSCGY